MILEYFLYERAPPVVIWGALALTGYTRISLPQIHFRAKSSESILVVLECLDGHLVASCGLKYRFRRLGALRLAGLVLVSFINEFEILK